MTYHLRPHSEEPSTSSFASHHEFFYECVPPRAGMGIEMIECPDLDAANGYSAQGWKITERKNPGFSEAWQPIASAPKDWGRDLLGWRSDCGIFMMRWASASEFMTDGGAEAHLIEHPEDEESLETPDWFAFGSWGIARMDGSEAPTHYRPLPPEPECTA